MTRDLSGVESHLLHFLRSVALLFSTFAFTDWGCFYCFHMEVLYETQDSERCVCVPALFSAHQPVYSLLQPCDVCAYRLTVLQVQSPEAADPVCGGVCPAGSRGCHAPVIHMVIVRGPARAQPHISSPVPLSASRCQPGEERREERRWEGNAVCLFACLLCFI